jgi:peptidoglycan/LPS O-acetylase OafA/YrhL
VSTAVADVERAPGAPAPSTMRYIPALDGLRGLSLPGTIYTHYAIFLLILPTAPHWLRTAKPFTLNIEMFFVLSGALITNMLVNERNRTGRISLKKFYLRRSRRLGPAMLCVVPLLLIAQYAIPRSGLAPLGDSPWLTALALLLFFGNWRLSGDEAGIGWMGPAWTLAIEEQFYLTWPTVLILLMKRFRKWTVLTSVLVVVARVTLLSAYLSRTFDLRRVNFMTPTHLPPLLLGCALGYYLAVSPDGWFARLLRSQLVALVGFAGMVWISIQWNFDRVILGSGGYTLYGAFSCLLIGHLFVVAAQPGLVSRVLSWRPLVVIGQVSYEAYLCHTIIILAVMRAYPEMHVVTMMVLDSILIAVVSGAFYYFIGRPIRRRGWGVVVGRPTINRGSPVPALAGSPTPPPSSLAQVFGVLATSLLIAGMCVAGGDSWTGAAISLGIGAVFAQLVARPAQR